MADLNPLIRVRKHVVEQKQKFLSELYKHAEELDQQKVTLLAQLAEEQEKTAEMGVEFQAYFAPYAESVKHRVADIDHARGQLEVRIEIGREDIRKAFAELKKIEITQERREGEEQAEIDKKESDELDEIGIEVYRRRQAEE